MNDLLVVALGGNALQRGQGPYDADSQLAVVRETSAQLARILKTGRRRPHGRHRQPGKGLGGRAGPGRHHPAQPLMVGPGCSSPVFLLFTLYFNHFPH